MTTHETITSTQEVAGRFHELAQTNQWQQIQDELFAGDAVSIEPENSPGLKNAKGIEAIRQKGKQFGEMVEEVHSSYSNAPQIAGSYFAVAMGMDVTMKGQGRVRMDEIALYEVRNGKIVKEQFFY